MCQKTERCVNIMQDVLRIESLALTKIADRLSSAQGLAVARNLERFFTEIIDRNANVIFCGVGKSGNIAKKLSATFNSFGCPGFFLHPGEALHGDLGRVKKEDGIVFLSKSGTTEEIMNLLPYLTIGKSMTVGLLGNPLSPLAEKLGIVLDCSVEREACPIGQAPTASSTAMLGMGDAMSALYGNMVGLSKERFAINHPGGLLGKRLKVKVCDIMLPLHKIPIVEDSTPMKEILIRMTTLPVGACIVLDSCDRLRGIIVEGDIRRTLGQGNNALERIASDIMNRDPITVSPERMAQDALKTMEVRDRPISVLPVVGKEGRFLGLLRIHDLAMIGLTSEIV